jgi:hypothetical protein
MSKLMSMADALAENARLNARLKVLQDAAVYWSEHQATADYFEIHIDSPALISVLWGDKQ